MDTVNIKAYAKINLSLDILGRREDGYHKLDTVMQQITLHDRIAISKNYGGLNVGSDLKTLPHGSGNIAYKAAELFYKRAGLQPRTDIFISKEIPAEAGLGGGSADAAAVLNALNEIEGGIYSRIELTAMGAEIGADVPFCVLGGACRCRGIGEKLTELPSMPDCFIVICKPPVSVSTAEAYGLIDRKPSDIRYTPAMLSALKSGEIKKIAAALGNHFDDAAELSEIGEIEKSMLGAGALGALMTGSGSAVYGIFEEPERAELCADLIGDLGRVFVASPFRAVGN